MMKKNNLTIFVRTIVLIMLVTTLCGCKSKIMTAPHKTEPETSENYKKGKSLLDEVELEEAIKYYLKALDDIDSKEQETTLDNHELNNIYNDLSQAYYRLGDYELSLEYIEKALDINPNEDYEYTYRGNAFWSLGRLEEAEADYNKAISLNENATYAIYGLGGIYYDYGRYEDALEKFLKYLEYDETDMDAIMYVIDCYNALEKYKDGLAFVEEKLAKDRENYDLLKAKGEFLTAGGNLEEAESFYEKLAKKPGVDTEISMLLGEFYYRNSKYKDALDYFEKLSKQNPSEGKVASWVIYCYEALDDFDGAVEYYQSMIEDGYESYEIYYAVGNIYLDYYKHMEAIPFFEKAIDINSEEPNPYINIMYGLYYGKRYTRCIEYGKSIIEKFPSEKDIPWYIGECYFALHNYEEAIKNFEDTLVLEQDNETLLAITAKACLLQEEYEDAEEYAEQCLEINPNNETGLYVTEQIQLKQKPIGKQLEYFIRDSYLYTDDFTDSDKINKIFSEDDISNKEIAKAIDKMKHPDDMFTFVIHDDEYDYYSDEETDEVEYREDGSRVYLRIKGFYTNTDNSVTEILDQIEDTKDKTLIIDLRDNTGGLTDCANNILDLLLGDCVTCTLISKEGYTYNYYSDASQIKFKKIYIFVNGYTASASELLTLGLKTYLKNVTVVGSKTFGKGVGQTVFEDKDRKLMVYLVNHYWNVREQNIMNKSITPDIKVKSNRLEDYMKKVK